MARRTVTDGIIMVLRSLEVVTPPQPQTPLVNLTWHRLRLYKYLGWLNRHCFTSYSLIKDIFLRECMSLFLDIPQRERISYPPKTRLNRRSPRLEIWGDSSTDKTTGLHGNYFVFDIQHKLPSFHFFLTSGPYKRQSGQTWMTHLGEKMDWPSRTCI